MSEGRTVWKFPLAVDALVVQFTQVVRIPKGARFLYGAAQRGAIGLWYEIPDQGAEREEHRFQIFGTGNAPIGDHLTYVASAMFAEGSLVLHVYEVTGGQVAAVAS